MYSIEFWIPIQQKHTPPLLQFSVFAWQEDLETRTQRRIASNKLMLSVFALYFQRRRLYYLGGVDLIIIIIILWLYHGRLWVGGRLAPIIFPFFPPSSCREENTCVSIMSLHTMKANVRLALTYKIWIIKKSCFGQKQHNAYLKS